jgi:hypothetical protein
MFQELISCAIGESRVQDHGIWTLATQELYCLAASGHSGDYEPAIAQGSLHYSGQASIRFHQQNRLARVTMLRRQKADPQKLWCQLGAAKRLDTWAEENERACT